MKKKNKYFITIVCGVILSSCLLFETKAMDLNAFRATMTWSLNKATVSTIPASRQGYSTASVFEYDKTGSCITSSLAHSKTVGGTASTYASKSGVVSAVGIHYTTSGINGTGDQYGYWKSNKMSKGTGY